MSLLLENHIHPKIAKRLAKQKILHVDELLKTDFNLLVTLTKLRRREVVDLTEDLNKRFSKQIVTGDVLYDMKLKTCAIIQTFIPCLDEILDGGLRMGALVEICGSTGSGKTQMCLNVAVKTAAKHKIDVLYVDTKRDFVASHVSSLIDALGFSEDSDCILERFKVVKVDTMYALISLLHNLLVNYKSQKRVKLLIVDSMATLYYPFIGVQAGEGNEGLSLLNHVASSLKKLSVQHNLAVLLVNLAIRWGPEENPDAEDEDAAPKTDFEGLKPAMGKYWSHVPNTRLFLHRGQQETTERTLTLDEYPRNRNAKFDILANGTIP